jgi:hypothetical protein
MLAGLAVKDDVVTPFPPTFRLMPSLDGLATKVIFAPYHPVVVGVKTTPTSALCPDARTSGRLIEGAVNPDSLTRRLVMVTLACELFVKVTCRVSLSPTVTVPKPRLLGQHESVLALA